MITNIGQWIMEKANITLEELQTNAAYPKLVETAKEYPTDAKIAYMAFKEAGILPEVA